jgi:hypothetical protein
LLIFVVIFSIKNFIQMKNKLRKLHINNQEWKWVIDGRHKYLSNDYKSVRVYSPDKKMYRIDIRDVWDGEGHELTGWGYDCVYPSNLKEYIINNIINS